MAYGGILLKNGERNHVSVKPIASTEASPAPASSK